MWLPSKCNIRLKEAFIISRAELPFPLYIIIIFSLVLYFYNLLKIVINCSSKKKKGGGKEADRSVNAGELDVKSLTWSRTWLLVVLYFSAIASATALVPRNKVFQLCELERNREFKCKLKKISA